MSGAIKKISQQKIDKIAEEKVYWFGGKRKNQDLDSMLVFILAKKPRMAESVMAELGLTDEDFRRALRSAAPGVFVWESSWIKQNERFGIDPPLPFPTLDWGALHRDYEEYLKQDKSA